MKKLKLKVDGMDCHSCEVIITDDLQETGACKDIKVSAKAGSVECTYDESKISEAKIKKIIEGEGYKVK